MEHPKESEAVEALKDPEARRLACHGITADVGRFQVKAARAAVSSTENLIARIAEVAAALTDELARLRIAGADITRAQQQLGRMQVLLARAIQRLEQAKALPQRIQRRRPVIVRRCTLMLSAKELFCLRRVDFASVPMPWTGNFEGLEEASEAIATCTSPAKFRKVFAAPPGLTAD